MADKLKELFPETHVELLQPMVSKAGDEARLPWNRHQRRRFKKAKGIVLNLFSGPDQARWSKRNATRHRSGERGIYFEDKIFWTQQFGTFYCSLRGRVEWRPCSLAHRVERYQLPVTGLMEDRGL